LRCAPQFDLAVDGGAEEEVAVLGEVADRLDSLLVRHPRVHQFLRDVAAVVNRFQVALRQKPWTSLVVVFLIPEIVWLILKLFS